MVTCFILLGLVRLSQSAGLNLVDANDIQIGELSNKAQEGISCLKDLSTERVNLTELRRGIKSIEPLELVIKDSDGSLTENLLLELHDVWSTNEGTNPPRDVFSNWVNSLGDVQRKSSKIGKIKSSPLRHSVHKPLNVSSSGRTGELGKRIKRSIARRGKKSSVANSKDVGHSKVARGKVIRRFRSKKDAEDKRDKKSSTTAELKKVPDATHGTVSPVTSKNTETLKPVTGKPMGDILSILSSLKDQKALQAVVDGSDVANISPKVLELLSSLRKLNKEDEPSTPPSVPTTTGLPKLGKSEATNTASTISPHTTSSGSKSPSFETTTNKAGISFGATPSSLANLLKFSEEDNVYKKTVDKVLKAGYSSIVEGSKAPTISTDDEDGRKQTSETFDVSETINGPQDIKSQFSKLGATIQHMSDNSSLINQDQGPGSPKCWVLFNAVFPVMYLNGGDMKDYSINEGLNMNRSVHDFISNVVQSTVSDTMHRNKLKEVPDDSSSMANHTAQIKTVVTQSVSKRKKENGLLESDNK